MSSPAPAPQIEREALQRAVLAWYRQSRRDLPWRRTQDPYAIWISEIMLQQTRVAAVLDKYAQFLTRFPTVQALAQAHLDDVLTVWSGLGYYRRARALHQASRMVVQHLHGEFPQTASDWRQLPGIGRYSSAAIASIAFNQPIAVVDGNVERVLERLMGERYEGERLWQSAELLLARDAPGEWNQAMMEMGATLCLPRDPQCLLCPAHSWCQTRGATEPQPQVPRKRAELWYALHVHHGRVLLVQRPPDQSLMAGMWELPPVAPPKNAQPLYRLRHSITDTDYSVFVVEGGLRKPAGKWVSNEEAHRLALTGLARKILRLYFKHEHLVEEKP